MVGLCGSVGKKYDLQEMVEFFKVLGDEKTEWHRDNKVDIGLVEHKGKEKRIREIDNKIILIFGEIYSYKKNGEYVKPPLFSKNIYEFILKKYKKHKNDFFFRLNGNFLILIVELDDNSLKIISDRLGTKPLFIYKTKNNLIFTSKIQSLANVNVDLKFHQDYLQEYFTFGRVFGVKTPIKNVVKIPPSSITNIDIKSKEIKTKQYWIPEYTPVNRSIDFFVDKLHNKLKEAIKDRVEDDLNYGLMLSGGFDSRLINAILNEIDQDVTCYHMNESMNKEAQIAKRIASKSRDDFIFLRRNKDHTLKKLKINPKFNNFYGTFKNQRAIPFKKELKTKDVIFYGAYADTLLQNLHMPRMELHLGFSFNLPLLNIPRSRKSYIERYCSDKEWPSVFGGKPVYFKNNKKLEKILDENIKIKPPNNHGVYYKNFYSLIISSEYFPITNRHTFGVLDSISEVTNNGHRDPYIDNRIIDFQFEVPLKIKVGHDLVTRVLSKYYPEYGKVTNSKGYDSSTSFFYKFMRKDVSKQRKKLWKKLGIDLENKSGSWTPHSKLIKEGYFDRVWERENISDLPFIKSKEAEKMYENVKNGECSAKNLYRLLTYIKMPIVRNKRNI